MTGGTSASAAYAGIAKSVDLADCPRPTTNRCREHGAPELPGRSARQQARRQQNWCYRWRRRVWPDDSPTSVADDAVFLRPERCRGIEQDGVDTGHPYPGNWSMVSAGIRRASVRERSPRRARVS